MTFLGKPESARCAVPLLIPVSVVISRQERPCVRRRAILPRSTTNGGRPRRFPLARALGSTKLTMGSQNWQALKMPKIALRLVLKTGGQLLAPSATL